MKKQHIALRIFCIMLSISATYVTADEYADLVMFNGKIITVDPDDNIVQAVAVKDSLIYKVGTNAEMQQWISSETQMMDLNGKTVTPGIIDAHTHLLYYGQTELQYVNLRPPEVQSIEDVVAKIAERVQISEPDEWIIGDGFYRIERLPNRYDLDPVSPDNPVFLNSLGGHYGSANSRALEIAGIDSSTEDPVGGIIDRDSLTNEPTGVFWNHPAMDLVRQFIPPFDEAAMTQSVIWAQEDYMAAGYTSFQDVNTRGVSRVRAYSDAVDSLKIRGYLLFTIERTADADISLENLTVSQGPWLSLMGDKFLLDGQPPTSYTYDPHLGPSYDMPTWDPDTLKKVVKELHAAGHQLAFHVMGDAAIDLALDAIEEALAETPRPDHRHRLEHVMIPTEDSIQRMKELGVVVSVQPVAIYTGGDFYTLIWGSETVQRLKPMRSILDAGIPLAFGTDYPTVPRLHPKYNLWASVERTTLTGDTIAPEEKITIQEALYAHTMGAAYAAFEEDIKGSIEVGKYADMTIWSDDLYSIDPSEIPNLVVRGIIVGGTSYENPYVPVDDKQKADIPADFKLYYNYPNPFNASTNIVYNLTKAGHTSLRIYNSIGQLVKTLVDNTQLPGKYVIRWDGTNMQNQPVSSGQYFFQLSQKDRIITKKSMVLK